MSRKLSEFELFTMFEEFEEIHAHEIDSDEYNEAFDEYLLYLEEQGIIAVRDGEFYLL